MGPTKGHRVFLHALAQAFGARAGSGEGAGERDADEDARDWESIVVGAPMSGELENDYTGGLWTLTRALGLADRVTFLGFSGDVPQALAQMDILVHASVGPEPFGLVALEAMAAGLPMIATAGSGPAEVVEDGVSGLLYPPGDIEALAGALRRLSEDPALRARLGAAAKVKSSEFSADIAAAKMLQVYESVLSAGGSAAHPYRRAGPESAA
ncbi:MAG: glycosyltransferase family 4 protein [Actinomycetota bacterium]|nr:glycosyltransferase family 4 protein [Actinomycetota bacterium]